jgi:hypothetical protein
VDVAKNGTTQGTRSKIDFTAGTGMTVNVTDDGSSKVTVQYINAKPSSSLPIPITFSKSGVLTVGTGTGRFRFRRACTIVGVSAIVDTAPTGADIIVDVNLNGTTIFTTQANRPTIAASANNSSTTAPDVTAVVADDYMTVDIDQVGSTVAGSDLTVTIEITVT